MLPHSSPRMRPASFANQLNYDIFYFGVYEILILTIFICVTLCNIASTFIINTKYITFHKCLDYLPPQLMTRHDCDFLFQLSYKIAYLYIVNGPILLALLEDVHSIINQLAVQLLIFILKVYIQTYLNFIYSLCNIFSELKPLCFFEMVLLSSSGIETQPGAQFQ